MTRRHKSRRELLGKGLLLAGVKECERVWGSICSKHTAQMKENVTMKNPLSHIINIYFTKYQAVLPFTMNNAL